MLAVLIDQLAKELVSIPVNRDRKGNYGWRIPPVVFDPYRAGDVTQHDLLMCGPYHAPDDWLYLWRAISGQTEYRYVREKLISFMHLTQRRSTWWFLPRDSSSSHSQREMRALAFFRTLAWYGSWMGVTPTVSSTTRFVLTLEGHAFELNLRQAILMGDVVEDRLLLRAMRALPVQDQLCYHPAERFFDWRAAWMQDYQKSALRTPQRDAFLRTLWFTRQFDQFMEVLESCQKQPSPSLPSPP